MNFQIATDLHLDRDGVRKPESILRPVADVLVIAGDFYPIKYIDADRFVQFAKYLEDNWKRVIWVPGNHDYRGMVYTDPMMRRINENVGNITIAHNATIAVDDVHFVCTTLWTYIPPQHELAVKNFLYDFKEIGNFNPLHYNNLNDICVAWLRQWIFDLDYRKEKMVVVTHHLPTWAVVSDPYRNDNETYGFANTRIDDLIMNYDIPIWVHGHSHDAREDELNGTLVIRNPLGYLGQRGKTGYDPEKKLTV